MTATPLYDYIGDAIEILTNFKNNVATPYNWIESTIIGLENMVPKGPSHGRVYDKGLKVHDPLDKIISGSDSFKQPTLRVVE